MSSLRARHITISVLLLLAACAGPETAGGAPRAAAPPGTPRPEHPDPSFERTAWANLNGTWDFDFDSGSAGLKEEWFKPGARAFTKKITVPFPWESALSGLAAVDYRGAGWYRRRFVVDPAWTGRRVFLRFGAVDWHAMVWINGNKLRDHEGGYAPFEYDITGYLRPGADNELVVRAHDTIDRDVPTGKQTGWYTPTSGIWQTVWLEARPAVYIDHLAVTPDPAGKRAIMRIVVACAGDAPGSVELKISGKGLRPPKDLRRPLTARSAEFKIPVEVPDPVLWSTDSPHLYEFEASVRAPGGADTVRSYFGMRTVKTAKLPGRDYEYIFLNDRPIYLLGALNQSFNPKGIYTFPTDDDIRRDVEISKEAGLNFLRIHIKADEPRLYYWADKLGLLMMCDVPSPWEDTPRMRRTWEDTFRDMVRRDFNHPSIFSWVLFNETWGLSKHQTAEGQQWVEGVYKMAKDLDPTRLIEENSPCNWDHVATDINSWHFYINSYEAAKEHVRSVVDRTFPGSEFNYVGGRTQGTAPLMNSEYGGIGAGSGDQDVSWCFKFLTNELRKHPKICGYVYTELMDIEWEHNGFVNYDRTPKEFGYGALVPGMTLRDLNDPDFVVIDAPPLTRLQAPGEFEADLLVSHWSDRDLSGAKIGWELRLVRGPFAPDVVRQKGLIDIRSERWNVVKAGRLRIPIGYGGLWTVAVWLEDVGENRFSRNYVNVEAADECVRSLQSETVGNGTSRIFLRFRPIDCADYRWPAVSSNAASNGDKLCGYGAGYFEYHIRLPKEVRPEDLAGIGFGAELSSKSSDGRLAWPSRRNPEDCPQTDVVKFPSRVTVSFNGVEAGTIDLPDDPADARGVRTHAVRHHPGSYGFLANVSVPAGSEALAKIVAAASKDGLIRIRLEVKVASEREGGLAVFGERLGRSGFGPALHLELKKPVSLDPVRSDEPVAVASARFGSTAAPSEWMVLGPFDNEGEKGFDAVYLPEQGIDLAAEVPVKGGAVRWKEARARLISTGPPSPHGDSGFARIDFLPLFQPNEHAAAYALMHARIPVDVDAKLLLGSDDGVKVWANGSLVHAKNVRRGVRADEDVVPLKLRAGWNRLLFKVTQGVGGWGLVVRMTAADGGAIEGLEFDARGDLGR